MTAIAKMFGLSEERVKEVDRNVLHPTLRALGLLRRESFAARNDPEAQGDSQDGSDPRDCEDYRKVTNALVEAEPAFGQTTNINAPHKKTALLEWISQRRYYYGSEEGDLVEDRLRPTRRGEVRIRSTPSQDTVQTSQPASSPQRKSNPQTKAAAQAQSNPVSKTKMQQKSSPSSQSTSRPRSSPQPNAMLQHNLTAQPRSENQGARPLQEQSQPELSRQPKYTPEWMSIYSSGAEQENRPPKKKQKTNASLGAPSSSHSEGDVGGIQLQESTPSRKMHDEAADVETPRSKHAAGDRARPQVQDSTPSRKNQMRTASLGTPRSRYADGLGAETQQEDWYIEIERPDAQKFMISFESILGTSSSPVSWPSNRPDSFEFAQVDFDGFLRELAGAAGFDCEKQYVAWVEIRLEATSTWIVSNYNTLRTSLAFQQRNAGGALDRFRYVIFDRAADS